MGGKRYLMNLKEAALMLGVTQKTLKGYVREGKVPAEKMRLKLGNNRVEMKTYFFLA